MTWTQGGGSPNSHNFCKLYIIFSHCSWLRHTGAVGFFIHYGANAGAPTTPKEVRISIIPHGQQFVKQNFQKKCTNFKSRNCALQYAKVSVTGGRPRLEDTDRPVIHPGQLRAFCPQTAHTPIDTFLSIYLYLFVQNVQRKRIKNFEKHDLFPKLGKFKTF